MNEADFVVLKAFLEQVIKHPDHGYFVEYLTLADLYKRAFCNPFVAKETRIRLSWTEVLSVWAYCPDGPGTWLFDVASKGHEIVDRKVGLTAALEAGPKYTKQDLLQ